MSKFNYEDKAPRNYDAEARELIKSLKSGQLYELFEVVQSQMQRSQTPERDLELQAVERAIYRVQGLDRSRLDARKRGYRSSMAADARAKDGNTDKHKKHV